MIENAIGNQILAGLISIDHSIRGKIMLVELPKAKRILRPYDIFFPTTAVLAAVSDEELDVLLIKQGETSYLEPYNGRVVVRIPGYSYVVPRLALSVDQKYYLSRASRPMLAKAISTLSFLYTKNLAKKIAYYLVSFNLKELNINHQVISDALNIRREGVSEKISWMEEKGWLLHSRNKLTLLDVPAIKAFAYE